MVTFNITGLEELQEKIANFDIDGLVYEVASSLKGDIRHRVHVEGKASDGSKIGDYSKGYMKVHTGNYPETAKKDGSVKGKKKKGQAGVFTKGPRKGQSRPVYNRQNDKKVILSLTRQMENDMRATEPIKIEGGYGIGYANEDNYNKAVWNEKRYGKKIWDLTAEEVQKVESIVKERVDNFNNS
jgi:hypothetical protein